MKWKGRTINEAQADQIAMRFNLPKIVTKILLLRGITDDAAIQRYLNPTVQPLADPFLLHDMDKACQRIQLAIQRQEKVMIYGDYDVDGITSTSIMHGLLAKNGLNADYYIPKRNKDGYGPNMQRYQELVQQRYSLLITVDNGISGVNEVAFAQQNGLDVIITDHHQLSTQLPPAFATIHPLYPQHEYVTKDLSGAGVAFKVAQAFDPQYAENCWDLAALGTVADVMNLIDDNRTIVAKGLLQMQNNPRPGLNQLAHEVDLDLTSITSKDIGFTIAPCLNAIGRLSDNQMGAELLMTNNPMVAQQDARQAVKLNQERKNIVKQMSHEALELLDEHHKVNIIAKEGWPNGLVGLVANQIMEKTGKPTIILTINQDGYASGSGRSSNLDLHETLLPLKGSILNTFGGHAFACGLGLTVDNIPRLQYVLDNTIIEDQDPELAIDLDLDLQLVPKLYQATQFIEPVGQGNEPLEIVVRGTLKEKQLLGKDKNTIKLQLSESNEVTFINFNGLSRYFDALQIGDHLMIAGQMNLNKFKGHETLQIIMDDLVKI